MIFYFLDTINLTEDQLLEKKHLCYVSQTDDGVKKIRLYPKIRKVYLQKLSSSFGLESLNDVDIIKSILIKCDIANGSNFNFAKFNLFKRLLKETCPLLSSVIEITCRDAKNQQIDIILSKKTSRINPGVKVNIISEQKGIMHKESLGLCQRLTGFFMPIASMPPVTIKNSTKQYMQSIGYLNCEVHQIIERDNGLNIFVTPGDRQKIKNLKVCIFNDADKIVQQECDRLNNELKKYRDNYLTFENISRIKRFLVSNLKNKYELIEEDKIIKDTNITTQDGKASINFYIDDLYTGSYIISDIILSNVAYNPIILGQIQQFIGSQYDPNKAEIIKELTKLSSFSNSAQYSVYIDRESELDFKGEKFVKIVVTCSPYNFITLLPVITYTPSYKGLDPANIQVGNDNLKIKFNIQPPAGTPFIELTANLLTPLQKDEILELNLNLPFSLQENNTYDETSSFYYDIKDVLYNIQRQPVSKILYMNNMQKLALQNISLASIYYRDYNIFTNDNLNFIFGPNYLYAKSLPEPDENKQKCFVNYKEYGEQKVNGNILFDRIYSGNLALKKILDEDTTLSGSIKYEKKSPSIPKDREIIDLDRNILSPWFLKDQRFYSNAYNIDQEIGAIDEISCALELSRLIKYDNTGVNLLGNIQFTPATNVLALNLIAKYASILNRDWLFSIESILSAENSIFSNEAYPITSSVAQPIGMDEAKVGQFVTIENDISKITFSRNNALNLKAIGQIYYIISRGNIQSCISFFIDTIYSPVINKDIDPNWTNIYEYSKLEFAYTSGISFYLGLGLGNSFNTLPHLRLSLVFPSFLNDQMDNKIAKVVITADRNPLAVVF